MGWIHDVPEDDLYDHEGYCVAVLGDGSEPEPIQVPIPGREGVTTPNSAWWLYTGDQADDRLRAVAVRAGCACGWRSSEMFPVDFGDHEGTEGFEYNDGPFAAWQKEHIGQLLGTTVPPELADAIATVRRMLAGLTASRPSAAVAAAAEVERMGTARLQEAVTAAKAGGASWDAIGKALGTSRQAAHQRFARVLLG